MGKYISSGQLKKLFVLLDQKNVTGDRFQRLLDTGVLADVFDPAAKFDDRDAFRAALKLGKLGKLVGDIFRLTVDYSQLLGAMIAAGQYDWKNSDITAKRFPIEGKGVVEFEACYFHFNRGISSENAIKEIKAADTANPWSAAKIEHVLSLGKIFPEEQRKFPIIGLGSVAEVSGGRFVPGLCKDGSLRVLFVFWFGGGWRPVYRFLAVRKVLGLSPS